MAISSFCRTSEILKISEVFVKVYDDRSSWTSEIFKILEV
jgi:hypothetical protein